MAIFVVGAWQLYEAVFQCRFFGPLKPRDLVERSEYVEDDLAFELASLPALAAAFDANLAAATVQAYRIHRAGRLIGAAVILLTVSIVCYAAVGFRTEEKGIVMAKKQRVANHHAPSVATNRPRLSGSDASAQGSTLESLPSSLATSPFQPYVIWRGGGDTPKPVRK